MEQLHKSGMIEDMKQKGVKWVYVCGVDNIMVNMVDSLFLGLTIQKDLLSASKSVKKRHIPLLFIAIGIQGGIGTGPSA